MRQKLYPISVKITNAHCTLLSQLQFAEPPNTNLRLAEKGEKLLERALLGYVRAAFPYLPEEGVHAFVDFLRQGCHLYLYRATRQVEAYILLTSIWGVPQACLSSS